MRAAPSDDTVERAGCSMAGLMGRHRGKVGRGVVDAVGFVEGGALASGCRAPGFTEHAARVVEG